MRTYDLILFLCKALRPIASTSLPQVFHIHLLHSGSLLGVPSMYPDINVPLQDILSRSFLMEYFLPQVAPSVLPTLCSEIKYTGTRRLIMVNCIPLGTHKRQTKNSGGRTSGQ